MKVVIDIPDRIQYGIKIGITRNGTEASQIVLDAVKNGTPLPEDCGRLGDLDALEEEMLGGINAGLMIDGYEDYANINDVEDCLECVKYADTIIPAERRSNNE